ncbi:DHA2 family efflux MFS transporter permease subunit [Curtobacterium sp. CFBP9011]|uniref:DHA2 family efflux MFS transporter permease subunit n=1 Tax=Curtobacterium sp. CFBP9011 TaxID=3096530 RepID=UPI002A69A03B|nr:DHA2 family efflux MFS transporter permease subunit [Curtobacterium sp. CFBP9011]MDY1006233.1 DHA2 family efflux MFS transporter permease subunit [Curtobacterium sp. CFBP9011]
MILAVCCMSLFIVSMDATVVNVALPSIGRELHSTIAGLQWTIDAYTLVLASLLLLSGSTADRIGRRTTFQVGLALFTAGSLLCSLAPSVGWLVVFRMVQAVGGSMMNPVAMSIITATFDDAKERARAVGVWGAVVGVSMGVGPLVGGALTDTVGWRAIFLINVPIGIAAVVLTFLFVPESRSPKPRKLDPLGQGIVIVLLASLVGGLIEGPRLGWASPGALGLFVLAAAALVALVVVEGRTAEPLIDLRFFRSIPFSSAVGTALVAFGGNGAFLFLSALYLQEVRGMTPFQAGLWTLPSALMTMLVSPISGRLIGTVGTRVPLVLAGIGIAGAGAVLTTVQASTPMWVLVAAFVLFGFGFGMVNAPITNTAVSGMPRAQSGSAAAVASTSRQTGVSLGVALAGTVTGASAVATVGSGFAVATHPMWWIVVGIGAAIVLVGFLSTTAAARRSVESIAPLLRG